MARWQSESRLAGIQGPIAWALSIVRQVLVMSQVVRVAKCFPTAQHSPAGASLGTAVALSLEGHPTKLAL